MVQLLMQMCLLAGILQISRIVNSLLLERHFCSDFNSCGLGGLDQLGMYPVCIQDLNVFILLFGVECFFKIDEYCPENIIFHLLYDSPERQDMHYSGPLLFEGIPIASILGSLC